MGTNHNPYFTEVRTQESNVYFSDVFFWQLNQASGRGEGGRNTEVTLSPQQPGKSPVQPKLTEALYVPGQGQRSLVED